MVKKLVRNVAEWEKLLDDCVDYQPFVVHPPASYPCVVVIEETDIADVAYFTFVYESDFSGLTEPQTNASINTVQ